MSSRWARALSLLVVLAVMVGCSGSTPKPSPTAPAQLAGTSWSLGLQGGTQPGAVNPPTLVFGTDGSISGFGGCGPYTATFTTAATSVTISDVVATPTTAPCAPSTVAAQTAYLTALAAVTTWRAGEVPGAIPSGVLVLAPIKLALEGGPTPLVFTLQ